jgi:hypothetical protein
MLLSYFFKVNMLYGESPAWQQMENLRHVFAAMWLAFQGLRFLPITTYPYDAHE